MRLFKPRCHRDHRRHKSQIRKPPTLALRLRGSKVGCGGAPWQGGAFQWVQALPGEIAPAGSDRSSHGGNEMAEAFD